MSLLNTSLQVPAQLKNLFSSIQAGQAPAKFSREFLKDLGFTSTNHHAFIPFLKGIGFLTPDGIPTQRYRDFLDSTKSKKILAEAIKDAYSDIFVIKSRPTKADLKAISGKFKTTYNASEIASERAARTFLALLELVDEDNLYTDTSTPPLNPTQNDQVQELPSQHSVPQPKQTIQHGKIGLHYNIQIHLPATKDVEVYNAIFKSLRSHLID